MKTKHIWGLFFSSLLLLNCSIDRSIPFITPEEIKVLEQFKRLEKKHRLHISNEEEPGQRLQLCLNFISKESKEPLINQNIKLYHTSSEGEYKPSDPNDESTARLSGSVLTNDKGQIFVQSILPGDYGSSADNRHIHMTVFNAHPEAYDIHFKQYTGYMGKNFIAGSDQHFLADLKYNEDSILLSFLTIEVKNPQMQHE